MVVAGRFQSYFYVLRGIGHRAYLLIQVIKAVLIVPDDEGIKKNFAIRVGDKAVVLILCNINSNNDHRDHLHKIIRCCWTHRDSLLSYPRST